MLIYKAKFHEITKINVWNVLLLKGVSNDNQLLVS